jgi:hypothetical protein
LTTAAQLPPGVTRNTEPCWVLAYANGSEYEGHDGPHFADADEAQGFADSVLADDEDPLVEVPKPAELAGPCYRVTSLCDYVFDEDDEGIQHFKSAVVAIETVTARAWEPTPIGFMCSTDCDNGCVAALAEYEREHGPILPPVPVADGQEPLIGGNGDA